MELKGIYDGFERWSDPDVRRPFSAVMKDKESPLVIAVDTNVLLSLYGMSPKAREQNFAALEAIEDHLFAPQETVREFWKNRVSVISDSYAGFKEVLDEIRGGLGKARTGVKNWRRDHQLTSGVDEEVDEQLKKIDEFENALISFFKSKRSEYIVFAEGATAGLIDSPDSDDGSSESGSGELSLKSGDPEDPILSRLAGLLDGTVGPAPTDEQRAEHFEAAQVAAKLGRRPGATDAAKVNKDNLGDYLIWRQLLEYCVYVKENNGKAPDLLFVTREKKLDWWRNRSYSSSSSTRDKDQSDLVGANPDLIEDFTSTVGDSSMVYMVTHAQFLRIVAEHFGVEIDDQTLEDAQSEDAQSESEDEIVLYCSTADGWYEVTYDFEEETFYAVEGDHMRAEPNESLANHNHSAVVERDQLIENGTVVWDDESGDYVFQEYYEFPSATRALNIITGTHGSGPANWRDWDDVPFAVLLAERGE